MRKINVRTRRVVTENPISSIRPVGGENKSMFNNMYRSTQESMRNIGIYSVVWEREREMIC